MDSGVQSNVDARFGKYTLIAKLATGGMGEIFLAKLSGMAGFEKLVVIKRLLPHLAEDAHFVTMLLDEARIAARLSHPNVCQVYDLGEVDGKVYIAMEFLEGVPCSTMLKLARKQETFIDFRLAANVLQQTAGGLHHAHNLRDSSGQDIGLVHRDVSPSNLFATVSGAVKVLDFGVAKSQDAHARTHTGALKGKYAYMSPEQVMAEDLDRRSDIFSMGIVFFEMLTTRRLFWRDSEYKMFQAIAEDPIPDVRDFRPEVPESLALVVKRALSRDRDDRFSTTEELGAAIGKALKEHGGPAPNAELATYVRANFDTQIRERRELVFTAVSPHNQPTVADGRADMGEHSALLTDGTSPANLEALLGDLTADMEQAEEDDTKPSSRWGLFAGLAATGVVVAVASSFALGYVGSDNKEGDRQTPPSVVVVQSGKAHPEGDVNMVEPEEPDEPDAGTSGTSTKRGETSITVNKASDEKYSSIFFGKKDAIFACFSSHPRVASDRSSTIIVELEIEKDGSVSKARISPRRTNRTPLGRCLRGVAKRVKFPDSTKRLGVRIPVQVAVKTTKAPPT